MKITIVKGTLKSVEGYKDLEGKRVIFLKETKSRDPQPPKGMPKWFKIWSGTVYQNQQPQWFKEFEKKLNVRLDGIDSRLNNIETRMDQNNLKPLKSIN